MHKTTKPGRSTASPPTRSLSRALKTSQPTKASMAARRASLNARDRRSTVHTTGLCELDNAWLSPQIYRMASI
jgi:hypothetical protein